MFITLPSVLGISYQALYLIVIIAASLLCCLSLSRLQFPVFVYVVCFLFFIYSPDLIIPDLHRNKIVVPFVMLILSSYVALWLDCESLPRRWYWIIPACIGASFLFLTKEDAIWILPFMICASLVIFLGRAMHRHASDTGVLNSTASSHKPRKRKPGSATSLLPTITILLAPFLFTLAIINVVCCINSAHYGVWAITDRYNNAFSEVCADLVSIDDGLENDSQYTWVSNQAIEMASEASPTFNSIHDEIVEARKSWTNKNSEDTAPRADLSHWALRDALLHSGGYKNATDDAHFWATIHDELTTAFNSGQLRKKEGLYISGAVEPIPWHQFPDIFIRAMQKLIAFQGGEYLVYNNAFQDTNGTIEQYKNIAAIVRGSSYEKATDLQATINVPVVSIVNRYIHLCHIVGPLFVVLLLCSVIVIVFASFIGKDKTARRILVLQLGLFLTQLLLMLSVTWFMHGLVPDGSGRDSIAGYGASIYALYGYCLVLAVPFSMQYLSSFLKQRSTRGITKRN